MAESIPFLGANTHFTLNERHPEDGSDTGMRSFFGYRSKCGVMTHTAWRLTAKELEQINRTGVVMVSFKNHSAPISPMWVGSRESVLSETIEFGGVWGTKPLNFKPRPQPDCVSVDFDFRDWLN